MKKIILVVSISLLNLLAGFAQEDPCYRIEEKNDNDTCFIIFSSQCNDTLFLQELLHHKKVYGDGFSATDSPNINELKRKYKHCSSWLIWGIGTEKKVGIVLTDSLDGKIGFIIPDDKRSTKKNYKFCIEKSLSSSETIKEEKLDVPTIPNKPKINPKETTKKTSKSNANYTLVWLCVLSMCVAGLIIGILFLWKVVKNAFASVNLKINRIDKSIEKNIQPTNKSVSSSSLPTKEIIQGPSKEDVLLWIKEEIKKQHPAQSASVPPTSTPEPQLDTDQVDCNWENGLFILQSNDKPIFRIHQKGNTFYYTLVESIKSYMPSMLISTENFIIVNKRTSDVPKGVEIVKEGIVIPNGHNQYRVDPNNKLVINII